MKRFRDIVRYPKIILGVVLISGGLLGVHLLLPHVVNTQGVRQLLIARAAAAYSGEIEFSKFTPALLPWPHVRISQGRLTDGDRIELKIPDTAVYMKILPLFAGKLRVHRIKLIKPVWRVDIGPMNAMAAVDNGPHPPKSKRVESFSPFIGFLGSAEAEIVDGLLDLRRNGSPTVTISKLNSRMTTSGGQLHLQLSGSTEVDGGFTIAADVDLHSINGRGHLSVTGLQSRVLQNLGLSRRGDDRIQTTADLEIEFQNYGLERVQAHFEARTPEILLRNGERRAALGDIGISGSAAWTPQNIEITFSRLKMASPAMAWSGSLAWTKAPTIARPAFQVSLKGDGLEIPPIRTLLSNLWGDQPAVAQVLDIVRGGQIPSIVLGNAAPDWQTFKEMAQLKIEGVLTGGRIVVPDDLFDLEQVSGRVVIDGGRLTATGISARQGNASASNGAFTMGLYDGSKAFSLDTLIDTEISEIPKALRKLISNQTVLSQLDRLPQMTGRASGRLRVGDHLDRITAEITAKARINSGDTSLELLGSVRELNSEQASARVFAKGRMGSEVLDWLEHFTNAPSRVALKTPFTMAGAEVAVAPSDRTRFNGAFQWDDGAHVDAAFTVSGEDLHLQRLRIRDAASDALISFRNRRSGRLVDAGFSGHFDVSSLDRLLEHPHIGSGAIQGAFQVHFDRDRLERSALDGELVARDIGFIPGNGEVIQLIEASLTGQGRRFDLLQAQVQLGGDRIALAGGGVLTSQAVDVKGTLKADTFHTQKLVALLGQEAAPSSSQKSPAPKPEISVRGKLKVEMDQLIHDRYRFAPLQAWVEFKERETLIDVTDARLCGIQMPGRIRLSDGMAQLAFSPQAKASSLQDAGSCLLGSQNSEKLLGMLDLDGALSTQGRDRESLLTNLKGKVNFSIEKGKISNVGSAGVFTNLLSYLSVNQYVKGDLPDLRKDDFAYNRIESKWVFGDGILRIDEGVLKSDAVNMVADGKYDLLSRELDLVVLVSPLTTVDWVVERIPVLGNILQGTLVAIPVRVKGPESDPKVVPLSPKAVGTRLGGILKRTIKTPVRIIEPLLKKDDALQSPGGNKP